MIRVQPAPEPATFDAQVRQPGLRAIAEMVGETQGGKKRPGPLRKKIAEKRESIPAKKFPDFWTLALDDLMDAYHEVCSYCGIRIERTTGVASVDHMIAKSKDWSRVYEWDNYRLASLLLNSRKSIHELLDPFEIEDGWFQLELFGFQVIPNPSLTPKQLEQVEETILKLGLNKPWFCSARERYANRYMVTGDSYQSLREDCPFVAMELRRQGRLRVGDQ